MSNEPFQLEQQTAPSQADLAMADKVIALQRFAGRDLALPRALEIARKLDGRTRDATELAFQNLRTVRGAIEYSLLQIASNPSLAYLIGTGTETFGLLTAASAVMSGEPVDEVRERLIRGSAAIHRGRS